jgi:PAS domain S-box-containing protein
MEQPDSVFRTIVENVREGILILQDREHKYYNQHWLEITGYSEEEFETVSVFSLVHRYDFQRAIIVYETLMENGEFDELFEFRITDKSGRLVWISVKASKIDWNGRNAVLFMVTDISSDKLTRQKIQENEKKYRELINTINSGVAIYSVINDGKTGRDYILEDFNRFALEHEGLEKKDVVGKSLKDLRPNIDAYGLIETFHEVWKTGEPAYFPASIYIDENFSNCYENHVFKLPSNEIVAVYNDVTEQQRAAEALRESEQRFDLAMKASRDGLYDWNLLTNEIYYSPTWKSMLGYEYSELPNDFSVWERLTDPEDVKRSWKMQQELIGKKQDRFEIEFKMKHKDGHWIDILSRATAVFDQNGKAVRIIGTHVDITERKAILESLQTAMAFSDTLVDHSPFAMWVSDREGTIIRVNQALCTLLHLDKDQIVGKYNVLHDNNLILQGVMPQVRSVFEYSESVRFDIPWKAAEAGSVEFLNAYDLFIDASLFPIQDKQGNLTNVICQWVDITKQKQGEDRIKQNLREKEVLLQELNHRTKNNMQVILSMLRLKAKSGGDESLNTYFLDIENKINSMALVHQKLYESEDLSSLNLKEYFKDLIDMIRQSHQVQPARYRVVTDLEDVRVVVDTAIPLGLILNELLSNTIKHAFPGNKSGEVRVTLSSDGQNQLSLEVADNGAGVPPGFDAIKDGEMGLGTVIKLAENQLHGHISFEYTHGFSCRIDFDRDTSVPAV